MNRTDLQNLSRKDLQTLAKDDGVRANMKSTTIINTLLRKIRKHSKKSKKHCFNTQEVTVTNKSLGRNFNENDFRVGQKIIKVKYHLRGPILKNMKQTRARWDAGLLLPIEEWIDASGDITHGSNPKYDSFKDTVVLSAGRDGVHFRDEPWKGRSYKLIRGTVAEGGDHWETVLPIIPYKDLKKVIFEGQKKRPKNARKKGGGRKPRKSPQKRVPSPRKVKAAKKIQKKAREWSGRRRGKKFKMEGGRRNSPRRKKAVRILRKIGQQRRSAKRNEAARRIQRRVKKKIGTSVPSYEELAKKFAKIRGGVWREPKKRPKSAMKTSCRCKHGGVCNCTKCKCSNCPCKKHGFNKYNMANDIIIKHRLQWMIEKRNKRLAALGLDQRRAAGVFVGNELAAKRRKEQEDLNRECKMAILPENFKDYESARILFIMNNIDRLTKKQKKNLLKCRRQLKTANKSRKPILTRCKSM